MEAIHVFPNVMIEYEIWSSNLMDRTSFDLCWPSSPRRFLYQTPVRFSGNRLACIEVD